MPLTSSLNEEQRAAVEHLLGPLLIAAVAGCGKTFVLVQRIVRLIESGVDPYRILAVTFSVKAAKQMTDRLGHLGCTTARVGTFHSLAYQIVRQELSIGNWQLDESDRYRICVKDAVSFKEMSWRAADVTHLLSFIGMCKASGASASSSDEKTQQIAAQMYRRKPNASRDPNLCIMAYETAERIRRERRLLTFDDMAFEAWALFCRDEDARVRWAARWDYVLQDECFVGETPVLLTDGTMCSIREMVESQHQGPVLTWSPTTGSVSRRVIGWARKPVSKPMVRVAVRQIGYTVDGRRLSKTTERIRFNTRYLACTQDHPVWTRDRGWVPAGKLKVGETLQVETLAPYVPSYANRMKHSVAGREKLAGEMRRKNTDGLCGTSRSANSRITVRGGNGTGPSQSEQALLARLGSSWVHNYVVPTGRSSKNGPTHYKLDLADPVAMIAIELDGGSHRQKGRPEADLRKEAFLRDEGWEVIRLRNEESWQLTDELLHELVHRCPAEAVVTRVDAWQARDPWVYDIEIDGTHAFYADSVLVHNCQDESYVQRELATQLAKDHKNYCVVGDPAQSIYSWRGASPSGMLAFEKQWGARVIHMARNYRCAERIIEIANNSLMAMPPDTHMGVRMIAERKLPGEVRLTEYEDFDAEGAGVTESILESHEDGHAWRDHVILFRTNAQSRGVEEQLLSARVPYVVLGGTNFYDRREVKDLLAYLRIAAGVATWDDVRRAINTPFRFLGKAFLEGLERSIGELSSEFLLEGIQQHVTGDKKLQSRQRTSAMEFCGLVSEVSRAIAVGMVSQTTTRDSPAEVEAKPSKLLDMLVSRLRYSEWLTRDEGNESPENNRVSNVRELVRAAGRFPTVAELLTYVDDTIARAKKARVEFRSSDVVTLCSIHRSKGLEWHTVYVLGVNDKILPHAHAEDQLEERRLFYVALTRAADRLELSYVGQAAIGSRVMPLVPSPFLAEAGIELTAPVVPATQQEVV